MLAGVVFEPRVVVLFDRHRLDELNDLYPVQALEAFLK